ncbi:MAG TPA: hypothetical protein VI547_12960 [Anaerolineales bacterium]|nr:hypothetical protein [Anaerolineales bacterium]
MTKPKQLFKFLVTLAMAIVSLAQPAPVLAQISCSGSITVTDIQPRAIYNVASVDIVITGAGFTVDTVVSLDNYGALTTASVSGAGDSLVAIVPAGVPAGMYTVRVIDGANAAVCASAITVTAPTSTPAATHTPAPTNFVRPVIAVDSYGASSPTITPGQDLDFDVTLINWGQITATNIVLNFTPGDFTPRVTGGQRVAGPLEVGQRVKVYQPLTASSGLSGKSVATLEVKAEYTDVSGKAYTETFTLTFPVVKQGAGPTKTPTPTNTLVPRPQLLVKAYKTDPETLKPGEKFTLFFELANTGAGEAKRITMILGGGSASGGGSSGGTPGASTGSGGISGGSGDFSNFAPLGSANVQFLGDIASGATLSLKQSFIVNASAKAGAFPMKITFAYADGIGNNFNDDQAITLLVYAPPLVEVSFYRPPDPFFVGQPGQLPLQIVNKSRSLVLLGNMTVTSAGAELSNNTILIGNLDAGGSFPLDAVAIPSQPGPLEVVVAVDYVDDFNQPQIITETLTVEVIDIPTPEPGFSGGPNGDGLSPTEPESMWDKIVRFVAGFFGFDSAPPESVATPIPVEGEVIVAP